VWARSMPPLAGTGLQPPRLHPVFWKKGHMFTVADDPDRMHMPWQPPSFIEAADPKEQATKTTVQELTVKSGWARAVRGALTAQQCADLLQRMNAKGFTPALLNIGGGYQQLRTEIRDGHRVLVDSPEIADWLLEVLRPYVPEVIGEYRLVGLNERLRCLCYTPGQVFEEHVDGTYRRPFGHPQEGAKSFITVQVYLHDIPSENGGATTFYPGTDAQVAHQPEAGSVLLFTQDLPHEGSLVRSGLKYTIRTEVMYQRCLRPDDDELKRLCGLYKPHVSLA